MCVIMAIRKDRPSEEMIQKAWARNGDGGGIAWREGKEVLWEKGLNLEEMKDFIKEVPLPAVAHFRLQSQGGIRPSLCHPFQISKDTSLELKGKTTGSVLFHNGTLVQWREYALQAVMTTKTPIPRGRWSDSRAIAWLCAIYGENFIEFLPDTPQNNPQRGIIFGPKHEDIYGSGWKEIDGIWCSNDLFLFHSQGMGTSFSSMCRYGQCHRKDIDSQGYCPIHPNGHTALPAATGGGQQINTPFCQGTLVSVMAAEVLAEEKYISKDLFKEIKSLHSKLLLGGRKGQKALEHLQAISRKKIFNGLLG